MDDIEYRRLPKELRHPVKIAMENGWRVLQATANGYRLESPGKTETFYAPFKTRAAQVEARTLMKKATRAVMNEETPESERVRQVLNDPSDTSATVECSHCEVEFLSIDGYNAHLMACIDATKARLAAEEEAGKAITPPEEDEPSEGRPGYVNSADMPTPAHRPDTVTKSSASGKIGNKEEDSNMGGNSGEYKRGPYNRREQVKPGIARAIYVAMRSRSQHRDEALSVYANIIGAMVEEQIGTLSDAETKLAGVYDLLGLDPKAQERADSLAEENERITSNLKTLKELLGGI